MVKDLLLSRRGGGRGGGGGEWGGGGRRRARQQGLSVLSFPCLVLSKDRTKFLSSQSGSSLAFQGKVSHPLPVVNKQGRGSVVVSLVGDQNWHSSTALAPATLLLSPSGQ